MKKIELCIVVVFVITMVAILLLAGCQDEQKTPPTKVYGKGDPSAEWRSYFGNGNMARLNFVQTQTVNGLGQAVAVLAERVRKLEDPNNCPFNLSPEDCNESPIHEH